MLGKYKKRETIIILNKADVQDCRFHFGIVLISFF